MENEFPKVKKGRVKVETKKSQPRGVGAYIWEFCKIILINVIVFCSLLVPLEFSYRVWMYFRNCDTCNNTALVTKLDAFNRGAAYGFLAPDPITGFSPADGTFVIREPGWNDATITISQGVRVNKNFAPTSADGAILAVGDSFVFGDQVSDDETWPSILERRLSRRVVNGGVSYYGAAQAELRAEHLLKAKPYTLVILSILVDADLWRDRFVNGFIFYRPAVIREGGKPHQATVEESRRIVSENFICAHPWVPEFFFWSYIAKRIFSRLGYDGQCKEIIHPKAATVNEILEFVVERLAALPVNKAILIQYRQDLFKGSSGASIDESRVRESIDEARMIREAANHHGVPVIDSYYALKNEPLRETYRSEGLRLGWSPHHSKRGNEIIADLIAREIPVLTNGKIINLTMPK
jgi:hypothetical protein